MWSQLWSSYIGCRLSKELHTSCVCSCIISTLDKHHSTCQTVYPQFLHSVADTGWGRLAQRMITSCQEQELDSENEVSPTVAQPPGTLFLPTSTTLLTPVHSENDSRVYFMTVLTADYCWRSWTCRIAAPYKFHVDRLISQYHQHCKSCNQREQIFLSTRSDARSLCDSRTSVDWLTEWRFYAPPDTE